MDGERRDQRARARDRNDTIGPGDMVVVEEPVTGRERGERGRIVEGTKRWLVVEFEMPRGNQEVRRDLVPRRALRRFPASD